MTSLRQFAFVDGRPYGWRAIIASVIHATVVGAWFRDRPRLGGFRARRGPSRGRRRYGGQSDVALDTTSDFNATSDFHATSDLGTARATLAELGSSHPRGIDGDEAFGARPFTRPDRA